MKILLDHFSPFLFAHGGFQIQIEETKIALEQEGVEVEYLRWWDAGQRGDIIHFFGPSPPDHAVLAHHKGIKFVITQLLGGLGARPHWKRFFQSRLIRTAQKVLPPAALNRSGWSRWQKADAYVAVTTWEAELMRAVFGVPPERVHVVPNGVHEVFFELPARERGPWLVTTASIFPVKRVLETAQAAVMAGTPYWVTGRPLTENDDYFRAFLDFCQRHPDMLRYDNAMRTAQELAEVYRQAHGFVLLSKWESQSLSALEAAACECPLLLSNLPWARATFSGGIRFCPLTSPAETAKYLRNFYEEAPGLSASPKPMRWRQIGRLLKAVYEGVLAK